MQVHHSNRMEALAAVLAERLRADPGDPLAPERIVVPHRTIGRWLSFELARSLGIAANLRFELPAGFAWSVMRSAVPGLPRERGFSPDQLRWRIHDVLPAFAAEDREGGAVRRYLADGDPRKRFELADRLARVFDRCVVYRPDWVRAWDGGDAPSWQARLWRRVAAEAKAEGVPATHWVAVIDAFRAALRDGAGRGGLAKDGGSLGEGARPAADWPRRASFFAVPSLSPSYLDALRGIGEVVELCLFVLNPCREYWGDVYSRREIGRKADGADPAERYLTEGNELLAAWGRAGRDTVDALVEIAGDAEEGCFVRPDGDRRLAAVQRDVLDLRLASEGRAAEAESGAGIGAGAESGVEGEAGAGTGEGRGGAARERERDDSIQVHVCHSPVREAEVLHDRLLALFDTHPGLAPADVLVLTPNLGRYGPAVEAVFGAAAPHVPLHVARRRSAPSPAARAFLELLAMRRSRFAAEAILAPLDTEAVRARFGIGEADLPAIRGWVREAGIRWGADAAHREAEGLPASGDHAWRQGLRRLLLGYALTDRNELVAGIVPCPPRVGGFEIGAEEGELLGRLVTYCERVFELRSRLAGERSPREWAGALREEIARFFAEAGAPARGGGAVPGAVTGASAGNVTGTSFPASVPAPVADEVEELRTLVRSFEREAVGAGSPIGFDVVLHVLRELADAPPDEPVRLADAVTVTSLTPGQVFPAEVVCVIGLNDGAFPRSPSFPSFDLVASGPPRRGDRDVRHEDRFVFLEAFLAARRAFLVSYTGRGQRDDAPVPPATVVDELVDYLAERFPDASSVVRHPLQPFSPRYFSGAGRSPGGPEAKEGDAGGGAGAVEAGREEGGAGRTAGDGEELFSYSGGMCEAARSLAAGAGKSALPARFEAAAAPPEPADRPCRVPLAELLAFFANPTRWFFRERLGVRLEVGDASLEGEEPFDLDALERYQLRSEVLDHMRAGVPRRRDQDLQRGSGRLPHAALGGILHDRVWGDMERFHRLLDRHRGPLDPAPVEIDLELGGWRVTGAVENAGPGGLVWWRPGRLRARDRIEVRLRQLALAAAGHEAAGATALSIEEGKPKETSFPAPEGAHEQLLAWLRAWEQGRSAALPFFPETSLAYAKAIAGGADEAAALDKARYAWFGQSGAWGGGGEVARDPYLQLVHDDREPFTDGFEALAADLLAPLAEAVR